MQSLIERFGVSIAVSFGLGLLLALVVLPITTNAQGVSESVRQNVADRQVAVEEKVNERREAAQAAVEERKATAQQTAEDKKLAAMQKACEKREKKVLNIMSRISDRGQRQMDVFTKISDRTQEFYAAKGYSVANYDALVADVDAKRTAAEAAVNAQSELSVTFTCDSEDPKGAASAFKEQLKTQIAALKEYRTAVKNLIVGVKSAKAAAATETGAETGNESEAPVVTSEPTNE